MSWAITASVGVGLLGASEQRKANSQASDAADKANTSNNALRDQAMPFAQENLRTNAAMQKFYQQNPFNAQQKTGYQNQNNTIDQFNGKVAPGLLDFANQMMGSGYQRQHGPVGSAGYSQASQEPSGGLLGGPFSMPQQQAFGQIDFAKMNPHTPTALPGNVGPPNPNNQDTNNRYKPDRQDLIDGMSLSDYYKNFNYGGF